MRDKDTVILESLYSSLIVEGLEDQKKQAENLLISNKVGKDIWKYKNKPENQEAIEKARQEIQPVFQQLLDIVQPYQQDQFGRNLAHLPELTKFYLQKPDLNLLKREYRTYMSIGSIKNKNLIKKETDFMKWAEAIHSAEALEKLKNEPKEEEVPQKESAKEEKQDENLVYQDENVIVYLANNINDPKQSVRNCIKYGKGSTLCISSTNARTYYHQYRWEDKLTTYFVWLKDKNRYMLVDADEDGSFQYNNITDNTDRKASKEQIIEKYPQLTQAFQQNIFKSIPIEGKELEFYEKYYDPSNSIYHMETLEDMVNFASFRDIPEEDWKGLILDKRSPEEIKVILQTYIESAETDIPHWLLERYPALKKRYWEKKKNDVEREVAEWNENEDQFDFTADEMQVLFNNKEIFEQATQKIEEFKADKKTFESQLAGFKKDTHQGKYEGNLNILFKYFPVDLSFIEHVSGEIDISYMFMNSVDLRNLKTCGGVRTGPYIKSLNLDSLEFVGYGFEGGGGQLNILSEEMSSINLKNLQVCKTLLHISHIESVDLSSLQTAGLIKLYKVKEFIAPKLVSVGQQDYKTYSEDGELELVQAEVIIAPNLKKCGDITTHKDVRKIDLSSLEEAKEIYFEKVTGDISLPALKSVKEINADLCRRLDLYSLTGTDTIDARRVKELNIPKLSFCRHLYIFELEAINLPRMRKAEGEYSFLQAKEINLSNVKLMGSLRANKATKVNMENVEEIGDYSILELSVIQELNLPKLKKTGRDFRISTPNLKYLDIRNLEDMDKNFKMNLHSNSENLEKVIINKFAHSFYGLFDTDDFAKDLKSMHLLHRIKEGKLKVYIYDEFESEEPIRYHPRKLKSESFKNFYLHQS